MNPVPVLVILTANVLLGLYLGLLYLRGDRKPVLIGIHLLLGLGGIETLAMLLHGTPDSTEAPDGNSGQAAALCFVAAVLLGLSAALLRRSRRFANAVLASHAGLATIGLMLLLYFVSTP